MSGQNEGQSPETSFLGLRKFAKKARTVAEKHREQEKDTLELLGRPWHRYTENAEEYVDALEKFFPGLRSDIEKKLRVTKERFGSAAVLDLAGKAEASSLGATHTFGVILPRTTGPREPVEKLQENHTIFRADLLTHQGLQEVYRGIDTKAVPLVVGFLKPVAAALKHESNPYSYRKISEVLWEAYNRLVGEGELVIDLRWITEDLGSMVRDFFESRGATVVQGTGRATVGPNPLFQAKNVFRIIKPQ